MSLRYLNLEQSYHLHLNAEYDLILVIKNNIFMYKE